MTHSTNHHHNRESHPIKIEVRATRWDQPQGGYHDLSIKIEDSTTLWFLPGTDVEETCWKLSKMFASLAADLVLDQGENAQASASTTVGADLT